MKSLRLAFLAAICGACPAAASPAGDIGGTWECRQSGVQYNNKPPILYVADSGGAQGALEVDGFAREVYGRAEIAPDEGGWWKIHPAQGPDFMIRPEAATKGTPSMSLRLAGGTRDYHCLKLPPSAAASVAPPPGAPAAAPAAEVQGAPADEQGLMQRVEPAAMPAAPAAPSEGYAAPKQN